MNRKLIPLMLAVLLVAALVLLYPPLALAEVSDVALTNATCAQATASVQFDGQGGTNGINFFAELTDGAVGSSSRLSSTTTVQVVSGTASRTPDVLLTWPGQPEGTRIRIVAQQPDRSSIAFRDYLCSSTGTNITAAPTGTATTVGVPTITPIVTVTPAVQPSATFTPTPANPRDQEQQQGITRLYDDFVNAVIFRQPNGDVQYYHLPSPAVIIGTTPYYQLDPALYTPGQVVNVYTAFDGWRVALYFQGYNNWRAVFYDAAGSVKSDAFFTYGDAGRGQPGGAPVPVDQLNPFAQPGQGGGGVPQLLPAPGGGALPNGFQPLQPPPVNLFPYVPQQQPQQPVVTTGGATLTAATRVNLSVRAGPSTSTARLGVILAGTQVYLSARSSTALWAYGTTATGLTGWMSTRYLTANLAQIAALPAVQ